MLVKSRTAFSVNLFASPKKTPFVEIEHVSPDVFDAISHPEFRTVERNMLVDLIAKFWWKFQWKWAVNGSVGVSPSCLTVQAYLPSYAVCS